jgi:Ni2+-binding GTPase involved in maturation of urease and hydrogenase
MGRLFFCKIAFMAAVGEGKTNVLMRTYESV